jgi:addiction module HigA family antidote
VSTNYAVAPGGYLAEWIEDEGLTQGEVATRLGCSRKQVNEVVNGHAPVTADFALRLERLTDIPADAWLRYETRYRTELGRLRDEESLAEHVNDIHPKAASYLRSIGATKVTKAKPGQLVSDFLAFHRCGTWDAFVQVHELAGQGDYSLAALTEGTRKASDLDRSLLTTWLRAGDLTEAYETGRKFEYDEAGLQALLPTLRARAATPDEHLLRDLARLLAQVGVVYMVVPPPDSLPLHGMTRWIDKRVPVIQQTGRRNSDGYLIWAFFHELGHVLHDPRGEIHVEYSTQKKRNTAAERSANHFARTLLFGEDGLAPFHGLTYDNEIRRVARDVGVSPGVAVVQMHRSRLLDFKFGNGLCVDLSGSFD